MVSTWPQLTSTPFFQDLLQCHFNVDRLERYLIIADKAGTNSVSVLKSTWGEDAAR
jgi:hypothetical protein